MNGNREVTASLYQEYLRDMEAVGLASSLLSHEQERQLAERIVAANRAVAQPGPDQTIMCDGKKAQEQLVEANLRLVISIAKRYVGLGLELADLIQEGNLGLMRAARDYDGRVHFSTYAVWWIRQYISRALDDKGKAIAIPAYLGTIVRRMLRLQQRLNQELGREPSDEELADGLGEPVERIADLLAVCHATLSLDCPPDDEESEPISERLTDPDDGPVDLLLQGASREMLHTALRGLKVNQRKVLELHYGLFDGAPWTFLEIADVLKVKRQRVHQIETKALHTLKASASHLRDLLEVG